jgi:hypothetical protein
MSQLLQDVVVHLSEIIRSELKLARTELADDFRQIGSAVILLVIGGIFLVYAVGLVLLAAVYALQLLVAPWLAALIAAVMLLLLAAAVVLIGASLVKKMKLAPQKTVKSLEDNISWLKRQAKS